MLLFTIKFLVDTIGSPLRTVVESKRHVGFAVDLQRAAVLHRDRNLIIANRRVLEVDIRNRDVHQLDNVAVLRAHDHIVAVARAVDELVVTVAAKERVIARVAAPERAVARAAVDDVVVVVAAQDRVADVGASIKHNVIVVRQSNFRTSVGAVDLDSRIVGKDVGGVDGIESGKIARRAGEEVVDGAAESGNEDAVDKTRCNFGNGIGSHANEVEDRIVAVDVVDGVDGLIAGIAEILSYRCQRIVDVVVLIGENDAGQIDGGAALAALVLESDFIGAAGVLDDIAVASNDRVVARAGDDVGRTVLETGVITDIEFGSGCITVVDLAARAVGACNAHRSAEAIGNVVLLCADGACAAIGDDRIIGALDLEFAVAELDIAVIDSVIDVVDIDADNITALRIVAVDVGAVAGIFSPPAVRSINSLSPPAA